MSGWGGWYHSEGGTYIGRDRFTATRLWSFWFFADWRCGVELNGFHASILVLPQRPLIELHVGFPGFGQRWSGAWALHLGWIHARTSRLTSPEEWATYEAEWEADDREEYERLREKFGGTAS